MFEDVPALIPATFFKVECPITESDTVALKKPYLLPDMSDLLNETPFADIACAHNKKGLLFQIKVDKPFEESAFPNLARGDSIELFIDTRDLKTAGSITRFCHHFVFFPKDEPKEITRFRLEDSRPHTDPEDLIATTEFTRRSYTMDIALSPDALHGFSPTQKRLGFTYRINRYGNHPQHFNVSSHEYPIEKHPGMWGSLILS